MADEAPTFTMTAVDPFAPFLVSIYSSMLAGDVEAASVKFDTMLQRAAAEYVREPDMAAADMAIASSFQMFGWRTTNGMASQ